MSNKKSDKPWYEKIYILIGIIAGLFAIFGISLFGGKSLFSNNSTENPPTDFAEDEKETGYQSPKFTGDGNNTVVYNNYNYNTDNSSDSITSKEDEVSENEKIPQSSFGEAIRHIHNNELIIKKEIIKNAENQPTYSSIFPGVSYSKISNEVRLIEVIEGYRDYKCSRLYHFDEKRKLTFALVVDEDGEHRLYFYNDTLIRYKDINGIEHDINYGLENFECLWTELALEESYEFFDCFNQ